MVRQLRRVVHYTETAQIILVATMGYYLANGGGQGLSGMHWSYARDFFGGYRNVGLSLVAIAALGILGLFSLAVTKTNRVYLVLTWAFSAVAAVWFIAVGISHGYASATIPGSGNTGVWTLGLAGLFFLFTRIVATIVERGADGA